MTGSAEPAASGTGEPSGTSNAGATSWQDGLSADYKGNASLESLKSVDDLAKSYIHAQSMIGRDRAVIPTDKSTPEEVQEFYSKLGMPAPSEYGFEGLGDDDFGNSFKELLVKNNILPNQGAELMKFISESKEGEDTSIDSDYEALVQEGLEDLRTEWGDGFDANVGRASGVIDKYGNQELKDYLNESGLGNDPMLLKIFSKIGASLGEDGFKGTASTPLNKDSAKARINEMYADSTGPMYDKSHPQHADTMKELEYLFGISNS